MNKFIKNERGITLPELLAVFVIIGFLGTIIISFLISGFKAQARIQIESELRDEADIIMAELISDFYILKSSQIKNEHFPKDGTENYYIELTDGSKLGFYEGKVHLKNKQTVSLQSNKILLDPRSKIEIVEGDKGLYHITLVLVRNNEGVPQELKTESEIAIIKD